MQSSYKVGLGSMTEKTKTRGGGRMGNESTLKTNFANYSNPSMFKHPLLSWIFREPRVIYSNEEQRGQEMLFLGEDSMSVFLKLNLLMLTNRTRLFPRDPFVSFGKFKQCVAFARRRPCGSCIARPH